MARRASRGIPRSLVLRPGLVPEDEGLRHEAWVCLLQKVEVFSVPVSVNRGDSSDVGVELPNVTLFAPDGSGDGHGEVERRFNGSAFVGDLGPDVG